MSNLVSYTFPVSEANVRIIIQDDQPWFVAADVCRILDISNPTKAVQSLDDDERMTLTISEGQKMTLDNTEGQKTLSNREGISKDKKSGRGGAQKLNIVNESGLYALIFKSRKPEAKKFRKWVTSEVLPAIRKHGTYIDRPEPITPSEKQLLKELVHKRAEQAGGDIGKTIAQIWSRIHNRFRVNSYHELPRHLLADVIEYINAMRLTPQPDERPISDKEYIALRNAINRAFIGLLFAESDIQWAWNRIRAIYGLQNIRQLPARCLPEVMEWVEQLREQNSRFSDFINEVMEHYRKEVISQGAPWTPRLKRDYQKRYKEHLPARPNWIEVARKVNSGLISA